MSGVETHCGRGACTCGAIKDGRIIADRIACHGSRTRVPLLMSDAAPGRVFLHDGNPQTMTEDRAREIAVARRDAAYDHMKHALGGAWGTEPASNPGTAADAYVAMCDGVSEAWRAPNRGA